MTKFVRPLICKVGLNVFGFLIWTWNFLSKNNHRDQSTLWESDFLKNHVLWRSYYYPAPLCCMILKNMSVKISLKHGNYNNYDNNQWHLLSIYSVPHNVLSTVHPFYNALSGLHILSYLILWIATQNRYYDLHFTDEETESWEDTQLRATTLTWTCLYDSIVWYLPTVLSCLTFCISSQVFSFKH